MRRSLFAGAFVALDDFLATTLSINYPRGEGRAEVFDLPEAP
ncbi:MAG: hypothetical protein ACOCSG_06215 [Guyparkeria sp.]